MTRKKRPSLVLPGLATDGKVDGKQALPAPSPAAPVAPSPALVKPATVPAPITTTSPTLAEVLAQSIQSRADEQNLGQAGSAVWWFIQRSDDEISEWWSEQRDRDLRDFVYRQGNDVLQGALASMVKKFKAMDWALEGPEADDKAHPEPGTVDYHQRVLAEAELGEGGWGELLAKTLQDYFSQDKGAFWELIGPGDVRGPIVDTSGRPACPAGIAALDSQFCQLTGDPTYPVLYHNPKQWVCPVCSKKTSRQNVCDHSGTPYAGKENPAKMEPTPHKLHATRVAHMVDMRSPNELMLGVGFCATSRVIAASQVILKLEKYKDEKLDDLPQAGLLILNNVLPQKWEKWTADYQQERRRLGHEIWSNIMTVFGYDPTNPISANFLSFASLPEGFNEQLAWDTYIKIVALSFGVDMREFWPVSGAPMGTAAETTIMHQKARGKGIGEVIAAIERVVNWKLLPSSVTFRFMFEDDEEERLKAEIQELKVRTIMSMFRPEVPDPAMLPASVDEIRQMLADETAYFRESFLKVDATDQTIVTDIRRKAYTARPRVVMNRYGEITKRLRGQQGYKSLDSVLAAVMANYRAGKITTAQLADFAVAELLEARKEMQR